MDDDDSDVEITRVEQARASRRRANQAQVGFVEVLNEYTML